MREGICRLICPLLDDLAVAADDSHCRLYRRLRARPPSLVPLIGEQRRGGTNNGLQLPSMRRRLGLLSMIQKSHRPNPYL